MGQKHNYKASYSRVFSFAYFKVIQGSGGTEDLTFCGVEGRESRDRGGGGEFWRPFFGGAFSKYWG